MKYLFVGLGSIGQRHLRNLRNKTDETIMAYRSTQKNISELNSEYNIISYDNFDKALAEKPDAVFITNPTSLHLPFALKAARKGCHLFIEKPISCSLDGLDELFSIVEKNKLICYVGFNLRFHPNLIKIKELLTKKKIGRVLFARIQVGQYLPDWHPHEDYRNGYSARKDLGGGVLLTLIHELDYAYWLFGEIESVCAYLGKLSSLEIDVEDTASIIMKTRENAFLEIHLDYIQKPQVRTCEIVGEDGRIEWDYFKNEVKLSLNKDESPVSYKEDKFERNDMYEDEMEHFLKCIKNKGQVKITPQEVKNVMRTVEAIKKSSEEGRCINLSEMN